MLRYKKNKIIRLILFLLSLLTEFFIISGCGRKQYQSTHCITIAGSTSVQPFAEKLAELYMEKHPSIRINVQGGGSSAGIQSVKSGACQIGTSSRHLKDDELSLNAVLIAKDGIVIIVHPKNPISNLTMEQIRKIFSGKITNWQEVGGTLAPITVVTREEGSGTRSAFEEMVMKGEEFIDSAIVQDSNGAVREIIATDKHAIGYISFGILDERVKPVNIDNIEPTLDNMHSGKYPLVRPFYFVTNGQPEGIVKDFIDFVLSEKGQKALAEEGLVTVQSK